MPTAWWLRPVSRHARVGEQIAVTWKRLYARPVGGEPVDVRRRDVGAEAPELPEAEVVEHDDARRWAPPAPGAAGRYSPGVDSSR